MRCLCLAEALRAAGHACRFLCRRREGDLIEMVEARGFNCTVLPATEKVPAGCEWLGASMAAEIDQSRAAVAAEAPDWLVIDHYALDAEWERAVAPPATRVMVIDDLADRSHSCDLLLDQQLFNRPENYTALIPDQARMLLGPAYSLLRSEFVKLRPAAEARLRTWPPGRVLVSLGGMDSDDATRSVLEALARSDLPNDCVIDVVMGRNAPHIATVRDCAASCRFDAQIAVDVTDMGARILAADLAIGAGGTMSWERACLGLPSLIVPLAENQLGVAKSLEAAGAAINLGPLREQGWQDRLLAGLAALSAQGRIAEMSATCLALVDGAGTARVVEALTAPQLTLRPCTLDDAERVWRWREADGASRFYRSGQPTPWTMHAQWFRAALQDPRRALFIVEQDGEAVAHLRLDRPDNGLAEIGLTVDPARKGTGLGVGTVALALRHARQMSWPGLAAEVHSNNPASARVFERNGFRQVGRFRGFVHYQIDLSKGALA